MNQASGVKHLTFEGGGGGAEERKSWKILKKILRHPEARHKNRHV